MHIVQINDFLASFSCLFPSFCELSPVLLYPAHLPEWAYPKPVSEKRGNGHMWIMGSWVFMIIHEHGGGILILLKMMDFTYWGRISNSQKILNYV